MAVQRERPGFPTWLVSSWRHLDRGVPHGKEISQSDGFLFSAPKPEVPGDWSPPRASCLGGLLKARSHGPGGWRGPAPSWSLASQKAALPG